MLSVPGSSSNELIIRPSPLLWLEEFEQANTRSRLTTLARGRGDPTLANGIVWRFLQQQVRQRGMERLAGGRNRDWPGYVYLPSDQVQDLIERKEVLVPQRWQQLPRGQVARMIAALAAWQLDRGIYHFAPLATAIIANSQVDLPLLPVLFSQLPAFALYLDLESLRRDQQRLPLGLFVTLNRNEFNNDELVFVLDHGERFETRQFSLQGELPDVLASQLLERFRQSTRTLAEPQQNTGTRTGPRTTAVLLKTEAGVRPLPQTLLDYDSILHLGLAATLLTCIPTHAPRRLEDAGDVFGPRPPWIRWEVGEQLEQTFAPELARAAPDIYKGGNAGNADRGALLTVTWSLQKGESPLGLDIVLNEGLVGIDYRDQPWGRSPRAKRADQ